MNVLHEQFLIEARELVQQATDDLLALEREGFSAERIDRVFRAFHTLKGSAGVVDLPAMGLTLHAAEDLLAAIHQGKLSVSPDVIDRALACLDQVSQWVNYFEIHETLPAEAADRAPAMAEQLRTLLTVSAAKAIGTGVEIPTGALKLPKWADALIEANRDVINQRVGERQSDLVAVSYEPRADCFFNGDDPIDFMRRLPNLVALNVEAREAWPPLAGLDPYACNLRLQAIARADRAEVLAVFRLVPDQVEIIEIPAISLVLRQKAIAADSESELSLVRSIIEEQRQVLTTSGQAEGLLGRIGAVARAAANAFRYDGRPEVADRIQQAGAAAASQLAVGPLLLALEKVLTGSDVDRRGDESRNGGSVDGAGSDASARPANRTLRVETSRIDALIDLVGELAIIKSGFAHLTRGAEQAGADRELVRSIAREQEALERFEAELRAAVLRLRMVPVAQVFRSFPRLVRDVAQRLGKRVQFLTRGETTESDKTIVDLLFEPLLHLLRNAVDHGIETPEQRSAVGKADIATITMQASRNGDRLVIEVVDDGRGIDPAAIRKRADEKTLLSKEELNALSDIQVLDLIFSSGFSTAAEVSDISGRGVGLDVVRNTIERVGGRVSMKSQVGIGTTISLDLPTTISISRIMVVEAGGQLLGIPMDAVSETLRVTSDRITQIKNNYGFVLNDRIIPICSLAEVLNLPPSQRASGGGKLVVVAETSGRIAALEVDAIRDRLEAVLKPMQGLLSNTRGYAGTTLLGDGTVLLVLDLKEVLP